MPKSVRIFNPASANHLGSLGRHVAPFIATSQKAATGVQKKTVEKINQAPYMFTTARPTKTDTRKDVINIRR